LESTGHQIDPGSREYFYDWFFGLSIDTIVLFYAWLCETEWWCMIFIISISIAFNVTVQSIQSVMISIMQMGAWSSGMIPASGAGGPVFDSLHSPFIYRSVYCATRFWFLNWNREFKQKTSICRTHVQFWSQYEALFEFEIEWRKRKKHMHLDSKFD
jgi:hypothetical protein